MGWRLKGGGPPYGPDVKKLQKHFGTPEPRLIPYEDIERVLDLKRDAGRFNRVVRSWRGRLEHEDNIITSADPGVGIRVLTEPERIEFVGRFHGFLSRHSRRNYRRSRDTPRDKLNDTELHKLDHTIKATAALAAAATMSHRELQTAIKATALLPRPGKDS